MCRTTEHPGRFSGTGPWLCADSDDSDDRIDRLYSKHTTSSPNRDYNGCRFFLLPQGRPNGGILSIAISASIIRYRRYYHRCSIPHSNGFNDVVTGYHTCNDPVIHALLSKGNAIDGQVHAKLYLSGRILPYPVAAHSVINLISLMPGTDVRNLVFGIALFSLALCVFPLKILITESRGVSTKSILDDIFAGLAASTFYNAAVAYHGFLPQVTFVPFALTALILLRTEAQESPQKIRPSLALSALSAAAAVASYSFAAAIVLAVGLVISPWGIGVRRHVKLGMTFTALVIIIMGANLIPLFELARQVISYFFDASKTPPILRESSSFGNLVGFLNPLMWTGLWWEQDYRMQSIKDPISQIVLFFSASAFTSPPVVSATIRQQHL